MIQSSILKLQSAGLYGKLIVPRIRLCYDRHKRGGCLLAVDLVMDDQNIVMGWKYNLWFERGLRHMTEKRLIASEAQTEWIYVPDVTYHDAGVWTRRLQCIIPYRRVWTEDFRYPLVVFIPGAAWQRQEMYNGLPGLSALARRGYAVASVQVREAALGPFPAQVEDVRRTMDFLDAHAAEFHLDMNRVVLAGDSSGGHLALMTALMGLCHVRGVIDLYGPTDMLLSGGPMTASMLGVDSVAAAPEKAAAASCGTYIAPERSIPPILIAHGLSDDTVKPEHSIRLHRQLQACGKRSSLYLVEGAGHGGAYWWSEPMLAVMDEFMSGL